MPDEPVWWWRRCPACGHTELMSHPAPACGCEYPEMTPMEVIEDDQHLLPTDAEGRHGG